MPAVAVKRAVQGVLARTPYRSYQALPSMVPGAPGVVQAVDRIRARRARPRPLPALAEDLPPSEIEYHAACPLCGHDSVRIRCRTRFYTVGQCDACDLFYRVPAIRPERVADLYRDGQYSAFLEGEYSQDRQGLYRTRLDAFSPMFDDGTGLSLLDFGCGVGLFMEVAADRGFDVYGVDLAPDSVEQARARFGAERVAMVPSDLGAGTSTRFDVITMWSVLAHLAEPWEQVGELFDSLNPGGRLMIYTVNADSLQRRAFGPRWSGFTKNHLIFWDEKNLRRLLLDVGFSEVDARPVYGISRDDPRYSPVLTERHFRAVEQFGGNMLHVVATR